MAHLKRFSVLVGVGFLISAVPVRAQGSIAGTVKDSSGGVLPGVTVGASSPTLIEKSRSAVTDGTGQYRIVDLRPGTYAVTFTLTGFNTVKREGLQLEGAFTATVNVEMKVGALEETITVTGETPLVDVQSTTKQNVLGHDVIDNLPAGAKTYATLATLLPGVALARWISISIKLAKCRTTIRCPTSMALSPSIGTASTSVRARAFGTARWCRAA